MGSFTLLSVQIAANAECNFQGYPYTKSQIRREAFVDIPPFFRAQIWSCLLDIQGDIDWMYGNIDKHTPTTTDRQVQ